MRHFMGKKFLTIIALITSACAAAAPTALEGNISLIESDYLVMEGEKYQLVNEFTGSSTRARCGYQTEFKAPRGYSIGFGMLAAVGYAERARITLEYGCVRKVEILEMQQ